MGLRERVTQPYVEAQERLQNALDLEARALEFKDAIDASYNRILEAERKATKAAKLLEQSEQAMIARTDAIVARHEALIARLEALVESKTPIRKAMVQVMVDEAVAAVVAARAAQQQESFRVRQQLAYASPSSGAHYQIDPYSWAPGYRP